MNSLFLKPNNTANRYRRRKENQEVRAQLEVEKRTVAELRSAVTLLNSTIDSLQRDIENYRAGMFYSICDYPYLARVLANFTTQDNQSGRV
jgi:hypothetical protein